MRAEGEGRDGVANDRIMKLKPGATQDHVAWNGYDHELVSLLVRANLNLEPSKVTSTGRHRLEVDATNAAGFGER